MKYIHTLIVLLTLNVYASNIYKCTQANGKAGFSDRPCPKNVNEEQLNIKDLPWTKAIESNVPAGTKIAEITTEGEDTLIKYNYHSQGEVNDFIRTVHNLSGKTVNLIKGGTLV